MQLVMVRLQLGFALGVFPAFVLLNSFKQQQEVGMGGCIVLSAGHLVLVGHPIKR